jgi:DNA-binding transcriptional LysR family regulator
METREIEAFLAVAEELHFGHAADRLGLTTSHISQIIQRIERHVGALLFERTSRRVRLTPLGRNLYDDLRLAYAQTQAALAHARAAARDVAGLLRIGCTATTEGAPLTRVIRAFESRHPGCQVIMRETSLADPYGALRRDEIDVLLNWLILDEADLTAGPVIGHRERVLAVAAAHPLAGRRSVSLEDVGDYDTGWMPEPFPRKLHDHLVPPRTPSGKPIRRTHAVQTIHETLSLTARGLIVHPTMRGALPERRDIVVIPIRDMPATPLGLIWRTAHQNARVLALAEVAADLEPQ